jgi:hypothetical protein
MRGSIMAVLAMALIGTGCSPAAPTSATTPTPSVKHGAQLQGTISVVGGYSVQGRFTAFPEILRGSSTVPAASTTSCADYAAGAAAAAGSDSRSFVSPEMHTPGDSSVYLIVTVPRGYRGPGRYDNASTPSMTGRAAITIPPASAPVVDDFRSAFYGGTIELEVRADGSGSLAFGNWGSPGSDSRLSGTASWTCR